jgi:hypothetical protein
MQILCEHHHLYFCFIQLCITLMKTSHSEALKIFCGHLYMTKYIHHNAYIMQFCPSSCYFSFHVTKYSSQHPVLKHLYLSKRVSFIPIQKGTFIVLQMFNFFYQNTSFFLKIKNFSVDLLHLDMKLNDIYSIHCNECTYMHLTVI